MTINDVSDDCFMGDHECAAPDCDCICHYEDSFGFDEDDGSDERSGWLDGALPGHHRPARSRRSDDVLSLDSPQVPGYVDPLVEHQR